MSQKGITKQLKDSYSLLQLLDPRLAAYLDACDANNMYFEFRWLLILFKREFSYPDVLLLWESLWSEIPGPNYQLFIGLSILISNRSTIMENKFGLSEILRHVNDLSMRIDLESTLTMADSMYLQLRSCEEKLPNEIRSIIGLPEIEEPTATNLEVVQVPGGSGDISRKKRNSASPSDRTITESNNAGVVGVLNGNTSNSITSLSTSPDAETLEQRYETGVSQFM